MSSFFTEFQKKYMSKCKVDENGHKVDLGGRYFAFILKEIISEHKELIKIISPEFYKKIKKSRFNMDTEKPFPSASKTCKHRQADLYIESNDTKLFIEIKWEDSLLKNQLEDYLEYIKEEDDRYFAIISLHGLKETEIKMLKGKDRCNRILCLDILKECEKLAEKNKESGILKLFNNFLEDHTMKYTQEIDYLTLYTIMQNSIGWKYGGAKIGKITDDIIMQNVPELWSILLKNSACIRDRFHEQVKECYRNKPLVLYSFSSDVPLANINKKAKQQNNKAISVGMGQEVEATKGSFDIYNRVKLKNEPDISACFGFSFIYEAQKTYFEVWAKVEPNGTKKGWKKELAPSRKIKLIKEDTLYNNILEQLKASLKDYKTDDKELKETINKIISEIEK